MGTGAYLGGAPLITSDQYLTTAGSILAVEALHTSYQRNALNKVPFANPLYTVSWLIASCVDQSLTFSVFGSDLGL